MRGGHFTLQRGGDHDVGHLHPFPLDVPYCCPLHVHE
jgi:hypothetical protein